MTIEEWQPAQATVLPDNETLKALATQSEEFLATPTNSAELDKVQAWCHSPEADWQGALQGLSVEELKALALIFAKAEDVFGNWQLGANNPAIWVCRYLKKTNQYPDKEYIRKIKSLSSNRYIPRGKIS